MEDDDVVAETTVSVEVEDEEVEESVVDDSVVVDVEDSVDEEDEVAASTIELDEDDVTMEAEAIPRRKSNQPCTRTLWKGKEARHT